MAKDVVKAVARSKVVEAPAAQTRSRSLSVGFKRKFTASEQEEIERQRREMRERLTAAG